MSLSSTLISLIKETIGNPITGAEVGVYKGQTSKALLEAFPDLYLALVDPWKEWEEGASYRKHKRTGSHTQEKWDKVYFEAMQNIAGNWKSSVYKMTSEEAAKLFKDESLDFCFLDGNHVYENVKQDIELWTPKIRKGGLFVGHDWGGRYRGVKKAVTRAFRKEDLLLPGDRVWGVIID